MLKCTDMTAHRARPPTPSPSNPLPLLSLAKPPHRDQHSTVQDAKLRLVNGSWLLSTAIAGIFPYVEVHNGFTRKFHFC